MPSPLYDILTTPYGGRGAFAREAIPKGTPILFCSAPYATVIFWKFRREVCAICYAYAFESGRSKWSIKLGEDNRGAGGAWFCSDQCRDACLQENEVFKGQGVGWWLEINGAYERLVSQMGKERKERVNLKPNVKPNPPMALAFLDDISTLDITPEFVDRAWSVAEEVSQQESKNGWKTEWTEALTEFELDTARFVLDGLVRKVVEDVNASLSILDGVSPNREGYCVSAGRWSDLMGLQDNELALVRSKPYILASRIRVYRFLRHLATSLLPQRKPLNRSGSGTPPGGTAAPSVHIADKLRNCLSKSAEARALMARDHGNVFGIWDQATQEEGSEMLGWGAYIFGSYFNHGCAPNLKKLRDKRGIQFFALRDVLPGEELCISYIDEDSLCAKERSEHLERDWFFVCRCARCVLELGGVAQLT